MSPALFPSVILILDLSLSIAVSMSPAGGWRRAKARNKKEQVSRLAWLLAASFRCSMPQAKLKFLQQSCNGETVQTSWEVHSIGRKHGLHNHSFEKAEPGDGRCCSRASWCQRCTVTTLPGNFLENFSCAIPLCDPVPRSSVARRQWHHKQITVDHGRHPEGSASSTRTCHQGAWTHWQASEV